jgi:SAM-dependent MidA family methyltransferase
MRAGQPVDPLGTPGEVDITAHVDFAAFAAAARAAGAITHGPLPQGVFLQRLGFMTRAAMLAQLDPTRAQAQLAAAHRLTAPEAMGASVQGAGAMRFKPADTRWNSKPHER